MPEQHDDTEYERIRRLPDARTFRAREWFQAGYEAGLARLAPTRSPEPTEDTIERAMLALAALEWSPPPATLDELDTEDRNGLRKSVLAVIAAEHGGQ